MYDLEKFLGYGWHNIENVMGEQYSWSKKEFSLNFFDNNNGFSLVLSGCPVAPFNASVYYKDNKLQTFVLKK